MMSSTLRRDEHCEERFLDGELGLLVFGAGPLPLDLIVPSSTISH